MEFKVLDEPPEPVPDRTEHSEGPWDYEHDYHECAGYCSQYGCGGHPSGRFLISGPEWADDMDTPTVLNEKDARLIAAAPTLLKALVKLHTYLDFDEPLGEGPESWVITDTSGLNKAFAEALAAIRSAE